MVSVLNFFFWTVWSSDSAGRRSVHEHAGRQSGLRGAGVQAVTILAAGKRFKRKSGMAARRCAAPFPGPAAHGHGGARSVVGIGSASRDADFPSVLARMVRFPPCVDMTHLQACPLVGRLRARDVKTRVNASGRIGPEGAGRSGRAMVRDAAAVASGRNVAWSDLPRRPSGRCPFLRGGGAGRWGGPDRGRSTRSPVRFAYR